MHPSPIDGRNLENGSSAQKSEALPYPCEYVSAFIGLDEIPFIQTDDCWASCSGDPFC